MLISQSYFGMRMASLPVNQGPTRLAPLWDRFSVSRMESRLGFPSFYQSSWAQREFVPGQILCFVPLMGWPFSTHAVRSDRVAAHGGMGCASSRLPGFPLDDFRMLLALSGALKRRGQCRLRFADEKGTHRGISGDRAYSTRRQWSSTCCVERDEVEGKARVLGIAGNELLPRRLTGVTPARPVGMGQHVSVKGTYPILFAFCRPGLWILTLQEIWKSGDLRGFAVNCRSLTRFS
jgi:hypothetical protein